MSIELRNVAHIYMEKSPFERLAIQNINLTIEPGEFVAIIGHSGSGKSTLIQHFSGILHPTRGSVRIDDVDLAAKNDLVIQTRSKVGMVFQYPEHQLFEETVFEDIAFGPRNLKLPESEVEQRVRESMDFVNLDYTAYKDRSPFQLSGGQMRRVAIAGVIALRPAYLILDEPTAGLDPKGRDDLYAKIKALYDRTKIAVILVSHNMDDVARFANRIVVLSHGEIKADGVPADVFAQRTLLQDAGLDVPQVTELLIHLKEHGVEVDTRIFTADLAVESILKWLRRRKDC